MHQARTVFRQYDCGAWCSPTSAASNVARQAAFRVQLRRYVGMNRAGNHTMKYERSRQLPCCTQQMSKQGCTIQAICHGVIWLQAAPRTYGISCPIYARSPLSLPETNTSSPYRRCEAADCANGPNIISFTLQGTAGAV